MEQSASSALYSSNIFGDSGLRQSQQWSAFERICQLQQFCSSTESLSPQAEALERKSVKITWQNFSPLRRCYPNLFSEKQKFEWKGNIKITFSPKLLLRKYNQALSSSSRYVILAYVCNFSRYLAI